MNAPLGRLRNGSDPAAARSWIEELLTALGATDRGSKWQCPAHGAVGDHSVALAVSTGDRGVLLHCHGGCNLTDVLGALRLQRRHLFRPPPVPAALWAKGQLSEIAFPPPRVAGGSSESGWTPPEERGFVPTAIHPYAMLTDPTTEVAWKVRFRNPEDPTDKEPAWFSLDPETGQRHRNLRGRKETELALYHQTEIPAAIAAGGPILIVESESSVDALRAAGFHATTWAGGSKSRSVATVATVLGGHAGLTVVIPDNDEAGLGAALRLKTLLPTAVILDVRAFIPDATKGADARDLLERLGADELRRVVQANRAAPSAPKVSAEPLVADHAAVPTLSWLRPLPVTPTAEPVPTTSLVWRRWIGWVSNTPMTPCTPVPPKPEPMVLLDPAPGYPTFAEALATGGDAVRQAAIGRCWACRARWADDPGATCEVHDRNVWEAFRRR